MKDLNADKYLGYGLLQRTAYDGERQTTARTYLKNQNNLNIIQNACFRNSYVKLFLNGQQKIVNVKKEIVLPAGAVSSPQTLMFSGIGQKVHLKQMNIPVKFNRLHFNRNKSGPLAVVGALSFNATLNTKNNSLHPDMQFMHSAWQPGAYDIIGYLKIRGINQLL